MRKVMRPTKDGGMSFCSSPDDKVGKGRCNHILGDEGDSIKVEFNKEDSCYYVNLETNNKKDVFKADEKIVENFLNELKNSLSEEEKISIMKHLKNL